MGAGSKALLRITDLVEGGLLPPRGRIVELGAQNLASAVTEPADVRRFLECFDRHGSLERPLAEFRPADVAAFSDAYFGALLKAVGFGYLALDLFAAPDTRLFDLNLQLVPDELRGQFDLVTNLGTSEHVLNQMLCMQTIHDLAKPGGVIYHDLPLGGYFIHGYFKYTPMFFEDIAACNSYEIVLLRLDRGQRRETPPQLRALGFEEADYLDSGIDVIFKKRVDAPFVIPVEARTAGARLDQRLWTETLARAGGITIAPVSPVDVFDKTPFGLLQAAYFRRLRQGIAKRLRSVTSQ